MNYIGLEFWADIFWKVGTIVLWIYVMISNRNRVTVQKIEAIDGKIGKESGAKIEALTQAITTQIGNHHTRMACLESEIKHVPTQMDLMHLSKQIADMNGLLENVNGRLTGINRAVDLMNEYLLNNKPEKGKS